MAKITLRLDTRSVKANGTYPLKIAISQNGQTAFIPTGIDLRPEQWNAELGLITRHPKKNALTLRAIGMLEEYSEKIYRISERHMTAKQLKDALLKPDKKSALFLDMAARKAESCATQGNKKVILSAVKSMLAFDPDLDRRTFEEITPEYLRDLDLFLSKTQKVNSRSVRFRAIRTIFNLAISEGVTTAYPFRSFKIRQEETRKRSLSLEDLRWLRTCKVEPWQEEYRDMFFLMVYLGGINAADLFQALPSDVVDGRLEYRRQKTHRLYSVKIEPEAAALIEKYKGSKHLISPCDRYSDYKDYLHHMNDALKTIGRQTGKRGKILSEGRFPELSSYWARHTIATLCASLDVPVEVISQILGHSFGNRTTAIYIKPDQKKADAAMRMAIDAITISPWEVL